MRWLFDIAWLGLGLFIAATAGLLPAEVGEPARRMTREAYLLTTLALALAVPWASTRGAVLIGRLWPQRINLPHKHHWMAPAQREASLDWLQQHSFGLGLMIVLVQAGAHYLELQRGQPGWPAPGETGMIVALLLFAAALIVWTRAIYRRFPAPPREPEPAPASTPRRPDRPRR